MDIKGISFLLISSGSLRVNLSHLPGPHSHSSLQHTDTNFFFAIFFLLNHAVYLAKQKGSLYSTLRQYAYSPHCSLYIPDGTDKENMCNDQQQCILMTLLYNFILILLRKISMIISRLIFLPILICLPLL